MIDRLIELISQWLQLFQFFTVVRQYERGVILRFGKFHREVDPGLHWMWPFRIEEVQSTNVVLETMNVGPQSLTTMDGVSIVISTIVSFQIEDVKKFLLEVEGRANVIEDSTYGIVASHVSEHTWCEILAYKTSDELTKAVRRQAKRYGVAVNSVQLADLTRSRSYRLIQPVPKFVV